MSEQYKTIFAEILETGGIPQRFNNVVSYDDFLALWEQMIQECEEGYEETAPELCHELTLRHFIDKLIAHPRLQGFKADHAIFRTRIQAADERLRDTFIPGTMPQDAYWWFDGILRKGSDTYVSTVPEQYRHRVQVPDYLKGV